MKKDNKSEASAILRQKAEELLKKKTLKTGSQLSKTEALKLIHELEVHQIELELQNEELMLARSAAHDASEKYIELYDFAPSGYFTLSKEGKIIELNLSGANILGKERSGLKNSQFGFFVSNDTKPIFNLFLEKVFNSKAKESCEVALSTEGNLPMYVHLNGIATENGEQCLVTVIDITEPKRADEELQRSEIQYRSLTENSPDLIARFDRQYRHLYVNPTAAKAGRYSPNEYVGKTIAEVGVPEEEARKWEERIRNVFETGQVVNVEDSFETPNGSLNFNTKFVPEFAPDGSIHSVQSIAHDITERKLAVETIIKERALLRTLIDNLPVGVFVKDKECRKIIVNPVHIKEVMGHLKYLGMNSEIDILGKTDFEVFPKELAENFFTDDQKVVRNGSAILNNEGLGFSEEGNQIWLLVSKIPLRDNNGEIIGMVGVTTDITKRRNAEESLKTSEEKFRTIFDNASDGMFVIDLETRKFMLYNAACSKMLGYSGDEFLKLDIAALHFSEDIHFIFEQIEGILRGEEELSRDVKFKRKDGTVFTADLRPTLITIAGKRFILIVFRDITERLLIETELRSAKEKAEESNKLKTAFLHNISHEIRTPLNGIIGFSDMITNPKLSSEKRKQFSQLIRISGDQLLSVVNDIISMATIEAGQEKPREKKSDINKLLQLIKSQNSPNAEIRNLSFTVSSALTDDEAIVLIDETKLLQILTNLVSNAIKFTLEGYIKVNCRLDDNFIKFTVEDTGIGIPPEMHEKIFDRFFQIDYDVTRSYSGTGLGLSIVKSFVHFLNGEIHLDSKPGKGSVFIISIPFKSVKQLKPVNIPVHDDLKQIGPATILIAEDETASFELLKEYLSDLDLTIMYAANGLQAVEACKDNPSISLVLMDVKMSHMDGYEAARQIKGFRPQLPIIIQTAYVFKNEREKSMSAYIDGVLEKPINQNVLLETLKKYL